MSIAYLNGKDLPARSTTDLSSFAECSCPARKWTSPGVPRSRTELIAQSILTWRKNHSVMAWACLSPPMPKWPGNGSDVT